MIYIINVIDLQLLSQILANETILTVMSTPSSLTQITVEGNCNSILQEKWPVSVWQPGDLRDLPNLTPHGSQQNNNRYLQCIRKLQFVTLYTCKQTNKTNVKFL